MNLVVGCKKQEMHGIKKKRTHGSRNTRIAVKCKQQNIGRRGRIWLWIGIGTQARNSCSRQMDELHCHLTMSISYQIQPPPKNRKSRGSVPSDGANIHSWTTLAMGVIDCPFFLTFMTRSLRYNWLCWIIFNDTVETKI